MAERSDIYSVAVSLVGLPLSNVLFPRSVPPKSVALHAAVIEVSHVGLLSESEPAFSVGPVVLEVSEVD